MVRNYTLLCLIYTFFIKIYLLTFMHIDLRIFTHLWSLCNIKPKKKKRRGVENKTFKIFYHQITLETYNRYLPIDWTLYQLSEYKFNFWNMRCSHIKNCIYFGFLNNDTYFRHYEIIESRLFKKEYNMHTLTYFFTKL